jgi:hypothetical protein
MGSFCSCIKGQTDVAVTTCPVNQSTYACMQDRPKAGPHRAFIACRCGLLMHLYHVELQKGVRSRGEEERVVATALLRVTAKHSGVPSGRTQPWPICAENSDGDAVTVSTTALVPPLLGAGAQDMAVVTGVEAVLAAAVAALLAGQVECVEVSGESSRRRVIVDAPRRASALLPGSFNPLHEGHMCVLPHLAPCLHFACALHRR